MFYLLFESMFIEQMIDYFFFLFSDYLDYFEESRVIYFQLVDGVMFEVRCELVFGDQGGDLEEMTEIHKFLEIHCDQLLFDVVESCVFAEEMPSLAAEFV